jgi:predicted phosphodiesterase
MNIYRHGNKYRVDVMVNKKRKAHLFATYEEAKAFAENHEKERRWTVTTKTPDVRQRHATLPDEPYGIAFLSDLHFGNAYTDYAQAKADATTIATTPGMYAVFHGDGIDNWILPKMAGLQRGQAMPFDDEMQMFKDWLEMLGRKLLVVVAGNHDNWTYSLAGIDFLQGLVNPMTFYDQHQAIFDIVAGTHQMRFAVRHKWRGSSILNPTHGMERAARDIDADVYVGGHTHIATLARYFTVRDRDRLAILTGTYKKWDSYGHALGLPPSQHSGAGVLVVDPRKGHTFIRDVAEASDYLTWKRRRKS